MYLTNEQMVLKIKEGNSSLLGELYSRNLPYIKTIVRRFSHDDTFDDLVQESYFALVEAVKHWNPDYGIPFMKYSRFWIMNQIFKYKAKTGYCFRIPSFLYERIMKYKGTAKKLEQKLKHEPSPEEIFNVMNLSKEQGNELRRVLYCLDSVSMDSPVPDNDYTLQSFIPDPNENDIDTLLDEIEKQELESLLWNIVDDLHGKEPTVLRMRYKNGLTLKECAAKLSISHQRVRQIEQNGIRRIRRREAKRLLPYIHDTIIREAYAGGSYTTFKNHGFSSSVERAVIKIEEARKSMNSGLL